MFHLCGWAESIDPAGALVPIAAIPEQSLLASGDDIRVPRLLPYLIGAAGIVNDASLVRAQIQSPTLRMLSNVDIEPLVAGALLFGSPAEQSVWADAPIALTADEALNFYFESNPAAACLHYGLAFLSDGPQSAITGNIFTVRCTAAITAVVNAWVNGNLTFGSTLPTGRYAVVGMRCRSTNAVAGRLVFQEQVARPGCMGVNAIGDHDIYWQRFGRMGIWGEFDSVTPPTLDLLGSTAGAETPVVFLDLVRIK